MLSPSSVSVSAMSEATACAAGVPRGVAMMDCAYGSDLSLRRRLTALELAYAVGVWARTLVRKAKKGDDEPITAADLAKRLSKRAWRTVAWRDGTNARLVSRFARVRAPPARARRMRSPRSG